MPLPTSPKVEIEFTPGSWSWTDVTADLDTSRGWQIHYGRTSPFSTIQPGSLSLQLRNPGGKYTPGVAVLADGTAAPYYPNVTRRRRIRVSTSAGYRFFGFIKSWTPVRVNGVAGYCQVVAADALDNLGRVRLPDSIQAAVLNDSPVAYYPMTDAAASTTAADFSGNHLLSLQPYSLDAGSVTFGQPGVTDGSGGTAATFVANKRMTANFNPPLNVIDSIGLSVSLWVKYTGTTKMGVLDFIDGQGESRQLYAGDAGAPNALAWAQGGALIAYVGAGATIANDGVWHHVGIVETPTVLGAATYAVYLDGNFTTGIGFASIGMFPITFLGLAEGNQATNLFYTGSMQHIAIYNYPLTTAQMLNHYEAGLVAGELVSDKVLRWTEIASLPSLNGADPWTLDTSTVTTGSYPQQGRTVADAIQDVTVNTEGGGAVTYIDTTGHVVFKNRGYTNHAAPTLTLDAADDLNRDTWQPTLDDTALLNRVQVNRGTATGTASTQLWQNRTSINGGDGVVGEQVTTYTNSDADALFLAQSRVAAGTITPVPRLAQVAVDLVHAKNNLYAALQNTTIGSRLRVTNLPAGALDTTQKDQIVEGWTETYNRDQYLLVFDTSPADSPAVALWQDTTYGRWQALPDCALNASITNSATTVVIATPTGPAFTTTAGAYSPTPIDIRVDAEIIGLNSVPGGGTSPQTFTGVTRGKYGTTPAAHASSATVKLWPSTTWTL